MITHRGRLEACLANRIIDRPPVALWRHFPVDDQKPERLAEATVNFQRTFDFDFIKVTPASSYCLKDWGVEDKWNGATEGTRDYTKRVIHEPDDWLNLKELDPNKGYLGDQLKCLALITKEIGEETPVIQTIFNPLSQAKNLVGKNELITQLRKYPSAVHTGLQTITNTTKAFIEAANETGIAGIFYAVQHASYNVLSPGEYEEFGRHYDLQILGQTEPLWFNVLHIHGNNILFEQLADYPVQVINWHDKETFPSLKEAKSLFQGVVCGGISREQTIVLGSPSDLQIEAENAFEQTGMERFILGTGCVVPITAPFGNLRAVRESVNTRM